MTDKPQPLLRSNRELRADKIWNWTLPAWYVRIEGKVVKTCPNAGVCAQLCYARNGTYLFANVKAAHLRNLNLVRETPELFVEMINAELQKPRFKESGESRYEKLSQFGKLVDDEWAVDWLKRGGSAVRIHDSGDFFSRDYLNLWIRIAEANPLILFYAYTKEVEMLKQTELPVNFRIIYSKGGLQDEMIDDEVDRHADVFPDLVTLEVAGYTDQEASDLLAVLLETNKVGIVANNISHFRKKQGEKTFAELALKSDNH